jgi:hypothetical protein
MQYLFPTLLFGEKCQMKFSKIVSGLRSPEMYSTMSTPQYLFDTNFVDCFPVENLHLDSSDDVVLSEHIDSEDESLVDSPADSGRKKCIE